MFRRKATAQLAEWKEKHSGSYAAMLEGARRVGKTTIAEDFARRAYRSYIKIDFANISRDTLAIFDDISDLDLFFLRLQAASRVTLYPGESVIIFDEIQLAPRARQAIKYLVADGRYAYIETGSLLSIRKNTKDIVIPSEEYRIQVCPMDYEEFTWAVNPGQYETLAALWRTGKPAGNQLNNQLMRDFRIYMAVGGMPQAVAAYVAGRNFEEIDFVKRRILELYEEDFHKIDPSGRVSMIFSAIPAQLALKRKRFVLSSALGKRTTARDQELFSDLVNSRTVLPCYHVTAPDIALTQTRDLTAYRMYLADTGLFVTQLFRSGAGHPDLYSKLLSDKLEANLGYLYENAAAQLITAAGLGLCYHTWPKPESTHTYEIDFLLPSGAKLIPIEVKSSSVRNHESITAFAQKYSRITGGQYLFSPKDVSHDHSLFFKPFYMLPFLLQQIS